MLRVIFSVFLLASLSLASNFKAVKVEEGQFINKENPFYCSNCGMHLPTYYKTNHTHNDKQYCSIHCLYDSHSNHELEDVKVVDTVNLDLIDAKKAFYVIDSKQSATMSKRSKYAFSTKIDAEEFMEENGGFLADFQTAYKVAKEDFSSDKKMIQTKREKMVYKLGKKLYESKCEEVDVEKHNSIASLKTALGQSCKLKQDKQLQAISVYLWDVIKLNKEQRNIEPLKVPEDAKCPICGMFVAKYPKWAAKLEYDGKTLYFDGPKDMMKYIFKNDIKNSKELKVTVTDYFTTKAIDGHKAYFVMGSDVYGPMGKEAIPFENDDAAFLFKNEHFGKRVLKFNEMTDEMLLYLD